jgi:hypothetical protein
MKGLHLISMSAALSAWLVFAVSGADAQSRQLGPRITLPSHSNHFSWERGHGFKRGFPGIWIVEREVPVIVERVVEKQAPAPPSAAANSGTLNRDVPGLPRKPYVIGGTYASLPQGCMKMIEEGVSYFYCSGEWYRQVRAGRSPQYKAVARRL